MYLISMIGANNLINVLNQKAVEPSGREFKKNIPTNIQIHLVYIQLERL